MAKAKPLVRSTVADASPGVIAPLGKVVRSRVNDWWVPSQTGSALVVARPPACCTAAKISVPSGGLKSSGHV